jgi:dTDP-4-amino-4,6-dideoxygalactose transaminase
MDNLRAALIRAQLADLDQQITRWNQRYRILESGLRAINGLHLPDRSPKEDFVGSSIQFQAEALAADAIPDFVAACAERGVELKWFGEEEPRAFTSRYDSWRYIEDLPVLPQTLAALSKTLDMRVPLTFTEDDCREIVAIIGDELGAQRSREVTKK